MTVRRRRRSRKWISWLVFLVLLISAGVVCYLVWDNYFNDGKTEGQENQEQVDDEQSKEDDNKRIDNNTAEGDDKVDDKKVIQYEGDDPNLSEELSGSVTYAGVLDDRIIVRVNIDQYLSEGDCELSLLSDGDVVYNESVNITNSASTATCEGFDVPVSSVGTGNYEIVIKMSSGEKSGVIKGEVGV